MKMRYSTDNQSIENTLKDMAFCNLQKAFEINMVKK